jgi:hypothetical protein
MVLHPNQGTQFDLRCVACNAMATAVFRSALRCGAGVAAAARCLCTITGVSTAF